ncbi:CidA/LrgA family protein [Spirosoma sp. HMF4905]|uniref:CidA/LrgA family protein n=1 Tax=Spirosoma arboris TaxID=2682092 RepID=A0A7K1SJ28_9BACT|nr:CidA/LrgA family protein [Spirosoma arboris]MVM33817.1 CidA/LrgA family protein [Spirosoma arboris]
MIKGLLLILMFYWLGEAVSVLINGFIPGSVIGMLFLFGCLMLKWVKPGQVRETAKLLTGNMALFLTPASVGIMLYIQPLLQAIVPIAVAIVVSTTLTILVVALVQRFFETRAKRKQYAK